MVHVLGGLLFIILYFFLDKDQMIVLLGAWTGILICIEVLRAHLPQLNSYLYHRLNFLLKKQERTRFTGATYFSLGAFLTVLLFSKHIALMALILMTFGDAAASVVGKAFGSSKKKSMQGTIAFIVAGIIGGLIAVELGVIIARVQIVLGSVAGAIAEYFSIEIDDNLTVPLVSGLAMTLLMLF